MASRRKRGPVAFRPRLKTGLALSKRFGLIILQKRDLTKHALIVPGFLSD